MCVGYVSIWGMGTCPPRLAAPAHAVAKRTCASGALASSALPPFTLFCLILPDPRFTAVSKQNGWPATPR